MSNPESLEIVHILIVNTLSLPQHKTVPSLLKNTTLQLVQVQHLSSSASPLQSNSAQLSTMATVSEYGEWESPISSSVATAKAVVLEELHVDRAPGKADTVYWAELRFEEAGRYVVCSSTVANPDIIQWTPSDFNSRTRVHEYGGGAFFVYDGKVFFSNFKDQQMYCQSSSDSAPERITPENSGWRYADGQFSAKLGRIYCVREDHSLVEKKQTKEATNVIVAIDPVSQAQHILVSGCDFYSSPRVSPDGKRLVWVQWNHPNMPWDHTELWMGELMDSGDGLKDGSIRKVVGGDGSSIMQPSWTPDNQLVYISDQSDWWNLYHVTTTGSHVCCLEKSAELGHPHWVFADYAYDVDPSGSGNIVTTYGGELGLLNLETKSYKVFDTGYTSHGMVQFSGDGNIYCIAGSPTSFKAVIRVNVQSGKVDILKESRKQTLDVGYFSVPEEITWSTANNKVSHGFFYPPKNKDVVPSSDTLPPLLVKAHGGPTGWADSSLGLEIQYFTSRGFAVLDVAYRGSTGYGRAYRNELRGNWGICDIEDCSSGAQYLAEQKKVDGNRLCIDGGSAGGYTTLACLAFTDVFKAGASHYGIGDLEALAQDTHKFESRYLDLMIRPYKPEYIPIYHERSPIKHIDKFNCPIAFFQGDEDEIVPVSQAEQMFKAVKEKGLPCVLVVFKGEQHGFRKAENIQAALDGEFYFFSRVFGFQGADKHCKLDITNLS